MKIDLDAIEVDLEKSGHLARCVLSADVLALVRAVRAAHSLWPLHIKEKSVGILFHYAEASFADDGKILREFNAALEPFEPFRKETP